MRRKAGGVSDELSRGIVTVTDVPKKTPLAARVREPLGISSSITTHRIPVSSRSSRPETSVNSLVDALDSERHPDLAVYLTPPPEQEDRNFWRRWVPDIVIEVVRRQCTIRRYQEKPVQSTCGSVSRNTGSSTARAGLVRDLGGSSGLDGSRPTFGRRGSTVAECCPGLTSRSSPSSDGRDWREPMTHVDAPLSTD